MEVVVYVGYQAMETAIMPRLGLVDSNIQLSMA